MLLIGALEVNEAGKGTVELDKVDREDKKHLHTSALLPPATLAHSAILEARGRYTNSDTQPPGRDKQAGTSKGQHITQAM